uniref:Transmembrane protein n=1 Tax=Rheinheimera sp. BAL341 TaxID=1708203 RepID=A0A486XM47_9GAMM
MADNFDFAALAKSWQQQTVAEETPPSAADLAQASQRQREQKLLMYAEWLGALIMAAAAVWLLVNLPGLLGGIAALFLALGALSTGYISWQVHRPILAYDNWSSSGLLHFRLNSCRLSLRYYRYTQLSCAALVMFTLILWLMNVLQLDTMPLNILLFYSLLVSPACLFGIYRLQQKVRQKTAELAQLTRLAEDFQYSE